MLNRVVSMVGLILFVSVLLSLPIICTVAVLKTNSAVRQVQRQLQQACTTCCQDIPGLSGPLQCQEHCLSLTRSYHGDVDWVQAQCPAILEDFRGGKGCPENLCHEEEE